MNETPFVVETSGLTKRFGDREVVKDVELHVPRGSAFGYLGPNGAGKTTLIRMLLGLTSANAGSMRLLGLPVPDGMDAKPLLDLLTPEARAAASVRYVPDRDPEPIADEGWRSAEDQAAVEARLRALGYVE